MEEDQLITTVQEFSILIGGFNQLWKLLNNKKISRFNSTVVCKVTIRNISTDYKYDHPTGKVISINYSNSEDPSITINYGAVYSGKYSLYNQTELKGKYSKKEFLEEFHEISPPLSLQEVKDAQTTYLFLLLSRFCFEEADKLYKTHLCDYVSLQEYQKEKQICVQKGKENFLNNLKAAFNKYSLEEIDKNYSQESRYYLTNEEYLKIKDEFFTDKRQALKSVILQYLENYSFENADNIFHRQVNSGYLSVDEYTDMKTIFLNQKKESLNKTIDSFLSSLKIDLADKFYQESCQGYISSEEYTEKRKPFLQQLVVNLTDKLQNLLSNHYFEEADKFYKIECQSYISISDYIEVKNLFFYPLKFSLVESIENILNTHDFDDADKFYQSRCQYFISKEEYTIKKELILNQIRSPLIDHIDHLLSEYLFIEADEFYQSKCQKYVNRLEYQNKRQLFWNRKKDSLHSDLSRLFVVNFTKANQFYKLSCKNYINIEEYKISKQKFVQYWINRNLGNTSDLEQSTAIGSVNSHVQLIARAGSGKTSTLVNRAIFLQRHCGIKPSEILLLAFNRKAAEEIRERLQKHLQNDLPYAMTFHALAYALVRPDETLVYNETGGQQAQSHLIQSVINDYLRDSVYHKRIKSLMIRRFKAEWVYLVRQEFNLTPEERLAARRTEPQMGIDGVTYKSIGEKFIADFLFEHDIPFIYERNFWWGYGEERTNYHPDFTILKKVDNKKGIVIEYFGLQGDPNYDEQSERKRQYWQNQSDYFFVEINPQTLRQYGRKGLEQHLSQVLTKIGLPLRRLTQTQLWAKIDKRAINRFDKAMTNFIGRCRKKCWTPNQLSAEINNRDFDLNSEIDNIEREFLHLAEDFYVAYLNLLQQRNEEDFDGIMQRSAQIVNDGKTVFVNKDFRGDLRDIKYIMIDEYQDFSLLFHNLISAIRKHNQQALFFCVGDDWQAINGFAGADLYFYENFKEIFQLSHTLSITTNYRSGSQIVDISNKLMSNRGVSAKSSTQSQGKIQLVDIAKFQMTPIEEQEHNFDLNAILIRLISKLIKDGKEITLLSRNNDLQNAGYRIRRTIDGVEYFDKRIEIEELRKSLLDKLKLTDEQRKRVDISTTHKYKGKEKQVIIILDADRYGNMHPDSIFNRIFGDDESKLFEDERRLLYVALTRAKNELFIVTDSFNSSPFIAGLTQTMQLKEVDWANYPVPMTEERFILVKVSNQQGRGSSPTREINEFLRSESYRFDGNLMCWYKVELIQTFLADGSRLQYLNERNWSSQANRIEVNFCNEQEQSLASYLANNGKWTCNFDNFKQSKPNEYDYDEFPF